MNTKLKIFLKLKISDKFLFLRILYLSGIYRMLMLLIPFKYLRKIMGKDKEISSYIPSKEEWNYIYKVSIFIQKICKNTPWKSKCLVQALIAQRLLSKKNIESTLFLGVGKDENKKIMAHAWVKCKDKYVTGEIEYEFGVVATFRK